MKHTFQFFAYGFLLSIFLIGCVDQDFDTPPVDGEDPDITANTTIAELKALHSSGEFEQITDNLIIEGVVIADDASGNFFRSIVIEDASGGIEVRINAVELTNDYPIGRRIYIKCNGLYLGDYNNLPQLGGGVFLDDGEESLAGIEEVLLDDFIVKGKRGQQVIPTSKTIPELSPEDLNTLIQLENVQFVNDDAGVTFADAGNRISLNRTVEDCSANQLILRTSGYADFADELTPTGNGSITAVFSIFGSTYQMWIRNLDDLDMVDDRCTTVPVVTTIDEDFQGLSDNEDIDLNNWSNVSIEGDRLWRAQEFSGNVYAQATSFSGNEPSYEMWLVTPAIDAQSDKTMQFESAQAFYNHDGLSVWASTDYDGQNIGSATWTEIDCTLAGEADPNHAWIDSGVIDLSAYTGSQFYIAFKYVGNNSTQTTSYRIDNLQIE